MITGKHAYIILTNLQYEIRSIEDCIKENKVIYAYLQLQGMKENIDKIVKPLYSTLSKKQKKELLDGWTPDTNEGSYIDVKEPKFLNEEKQ